MVGTDIEKNPKKEADEMYELYLDIVSFGVCFLFDMIEIKGYNQDLKKIIQKLFVIVSHPNNLFWIGL